jgi:hypothetical protein
MRSQPGQIGEVKRVGGWRGSPNSIAALLRCQVPIALGRKCKRCGNLALRGLDHCRMHAHGMAPRLSDAAGRGESRLLARMEGAGLLPLELLALPVWRNLAGIRTSLRAPARLALVQAWDRRLTSPLRWSQVQRAAIDLGATPGPRQNTAWWYENR